jgi:hypothetical protein
MQHTQISIAVQGPVCCRNRVPFERGFNRRHNQTMSVCVSAIVIARTMSVSFQRSRLLSVCGALIEDQVTGYGERGSVAGRAWINCRLVDIASSQYGTFGKRGLFLILLGKYRPCRIEGCQTWASARPETAH